MSQVLLQLEGGHCTAYHDMPCDDPVRIVVSFASMAGQAARDDARALFDELVSQCRQMGTKGPQPACMGRYRGSGNCRADFDPAAIREVNVLAVVEDTNADYETGRVQQFLALPNPAIIPLAPVGGRQQPSPAIQRNILYPYAPGRPAEAALELLTSAQVGADSLRIFVSYRHDDCATIAGQVFHALAEDRFAVFLDRFCGDPGQDFVGRILSELFDKGCLLVLEAADTHQSHWVQTEIATAFMHRLGVVKVNLGGSPDRLQAVEKLDLAKGRRRVNRNSRISDADLVEIVRAVRHHLPEQGARRRRWLAANLEFAVQDAVKHGAADQGSAGGGRMVQSAGGGWAPVTRYRASLTARPPLASTFRLAQMTAGGAVPVMFGPLAHQLSGAAADTNWIAGLSGVRAEDEGAMIPAMRRAAAGTL